MSAERARAILNELIDRLERQPKRSRSITRLLPQSFEAAGDRDAFAGFLKAAERAGAVRLVQGRGELAHLLQRIYLSDKDALYAFLGRTPKATLAATAAGTLIASLTPEMYEGTAAHSLAVDLAESWQGGRRLYGLGPTDLALAHQFLLCVAAADERDFGGHDMRTISRRRTGNSKMIEKHQARLARWIRDHGLAAQGTDDKEALRAIGLEKFPQDVRIAGPVLFDTRPLPDAPYVGVPSDAVERLTPGVHARSLVTVENLASFNRYVREARTRHEIVLYTGGYPSAAVGHAIHQLGRGLMGGIHHWGDIDGHGLRIAVTVALHAERRVSLLQMTPDLARAHGTPAAPDEVDVPNQLDEDFKALARFLASPDAHILEQEELDPTSPSAADAFRQRGVG